MVMANILLSIWVVITLGTGCLLNYLAGLTGIEIIVSGSGIVVLILEIISILIGLAFWLLYRWSCGVTAYYGRKINKAKQNMKMKCSRTKNNINNYKETKQKQMKDWYDKQWFAVEDDVESNNETTE